METTRVLKNINNDNYVVSNNVIKVRDNAGVFQYSIDDVNWVNVTTDDNKQFVQVVSKNIFLPSNFKEGDYYILEGKKGKINNTTQGSDFALLFSDVSLTDIPFGCNLILKKGGNTLSIKYYGNYWTILYVDNNPSVLDYVDGYFFYPNENIEKRDGHVNNNLITIYGNFLSSVGEKVTIFYRFNKSKCGTYNVVNKQFDGSATIVEIDTDLGINDVVGVQLRPTQNIDAITYKLYKVENGNFVEKNLIDGMLFYIVADGSFYLYKEGLLYNTDYNKQEVRKFFLIGSCQYGKKAFLIDNNYVTQNVSNYYVENYIDSKQDYVVSSKGNSVVFLSRNYNNPVGIYLRLINMQYSYPWYLGEIILPITESEFYTVYGYKVKIISDSYIVVALNSYTSKVFVFKYSLTGGIDPTPIFSESFNSPFANLFSFKDNTFLLHTTNYSYNEAQYKYYKVTNDVVTNIANNINTFEVFYYGSLYIDSSFACYYKDISFYVDKISISDDGIITVDKSNKIDFFAPSASVNGIIELDSKSVAISVTENGSDVYLYKINFKNDYTISDYMPYKMAGVIGDFNSFIRNEDYIYNLVSISNKKAVLVFKFEDGVLKYLYKIMVTVTNENIQHFIKCDSGFYVTLSTGFQFFIRKILDKYVSKYIVGAFLESKTGGSVDVLTSRFDHTNENLITGEFYYYDYAAGLNTNGNGIPYGYAISNTTVDRQYIIPFKDGSVYKAEVSENAVKLNNAVFKSYNMDVNNSQEIPSSYAISEKFQQKQLTNSFGMNLKGCNTISDCLNRVDKLSKILSVNVVSSSMCRDGDALKYNGDLYLAESAGMFTMTGKNWHRITNKFLKSGNKYTKFSKINVGDALFADELGNLYLGYVEESFNLENNVDLNTEQYKVTLTDMQFDYENLVHYRYNMYIRVKINKSNNSCIIDLISFSFVTKSYSVIHSRIISLSANVTYLKVFVIDKYVYIFVKEENTYPRYIIYSVNDNNTLSFLINNFITSMSNSVVFDVVRFNEYSKDFIIFANNAVYLMNMLGSIYNYSVVQYDIANYTPPNFSFCKVVRTIYGLYIVVKVGNDIVTYHFGYNSDDGEYYYNSYNFVANNILSNKLIRCRQYNQNDVFFYRSVNNKLAYIVFNNGYYIGVAETTILLQDDNWSVANIGDNKYRCFFKDNNDVYYYDFIVYDYNNYVITDSNVLFANGDIGLVKSIKFANDYSSNNSYSIFYSDNTNSKILNFISVTKQDVRFVGVSIKDNIIQGDDVEYATQGVVEIQQYTKGQKIYVNQHGMLVTTSTKYYIGIMVDDYVLKIYSRSEIMKLENNTSVANEANEGSMRYRVEGNSSYVDICMRTGDNTYEWVTIMQKTW